MSDAQSQHPVFAVPVLTVSTPFNDVATVVTTPWQYQGKTEELKATAEQIHRLLGPESRAQVSHHGEGNGQAIMVYHADDRGGLVYNDLAWRQHVAATIQPEFTGYARVEVTQQFSFDYEPLATHLSFVFPVGSAGIIDTSQATLASIQEAASWRITADYDSALLDYLECTLTEPCTDNTAVPAVAEAIAEQLGILTAAASRGYYPTKNRVIDTFVPNRG